MANRGTVVRKKKKERSAPVVRRGNKLAGPSFMDCESWSGEEYHTKRAVAHDFYYENYKPVDLLTDVWSWMKENKYSPADIRAAKAYGVGVAVSINCKLLRSGMPDFNQKHADYWTALPGTGDILHPVSEFIKRRLDEAILKGRAIVDAEIQAEKALKPVRQNIQELMRERAGDASAELDVLFDEFVQSGCPKEFETQKRILAELETRKVLPQHIATLIKAWERIRNEQVEAMAGKDAQLNEAYASYSRTQMKNILRFVEQVISDLNAYVAIKQATKTKTVRVRKPVPVEKTVAKVKYLKVFKDDAAKVDLTSLHPAKLHQASEAWLYDTKKRKLHHFVADDYSKVLIVKGSALLGFDKQESEVKTVRKPSEQLKQVMGSRPAARKFFKDIKAVSTVPNGRINKDMIILKVY